VAGREGDFVEAKRTAPASESTPAAGVATISCETFGRIVLEHQRQIHRILLAMLHDPDAADTLTQECFLRAFERRASFRGQARVRTWLVRIAINLARDHRRSRRVAFWRSLMRTGRSSSATAPAPWVPDPGPSVERVVMARERLTAVRAAVDRLSHRQRACFYLRFAEVMTLEEIAQAMDLKVGTVKAHLARAVGAVRKLLVQEDDSKDGLCPDARPPHRDVMP
jgi:RNA polymerase sigma-70 factor (ECF subfamily)